MRPHLQSGTHIMAIKLTTENEPKITTAIADEAGRKKAFVHDFADLLIEAHRAEQRLEAFGLAKARRVGATAVSILAGPARSYRYKAEGTRVYMTRRATGWFLERVEVCDIYPGSASLLNVRLNEEQRAAAEAARMRDLHISVR